MTWLSGLYHEKVNIKIVIFFNFQKYTCDKCGKELSYHKRYVKHITTCEGSLAVPHKKFTCERCGILFNRKSNLTRYLKKCSNMAKPVYRCESCQKQFVTQNNLTNHKKVCSRVLSNKQKSPRKFKCSACREEFNNRGELYRHRVSQHGGGDPNALQQFELTSPPWKNEEGVTVDTSLEQVYNDNALHILAPHRDGEVVKKYNFPTDNLQGGLEEIMSHIEKIYEKENQSFKINLNFGFILQDKTSGEYRYYIPYANSYLFERPFVVTRHGSLRTLKNKIKKIDLYEYIMRNRPNSKWVPVFITNINYDVASMNYALGVTESSLPKHVKDSRHILTFEKNPNTKKPYSDNLCFFRCLAWHEMKTEAGLDVLTRHKYNSWLNFTDQSGAKSFKGIKLDDIPDLENCFQINISVFQLLENHSVMVIYKSTANFENDLCLDMQQNHLSYVKDLDMYAQRFQCNKCTRLFKKIKSLKKHYPNCSRVTKLRCPGGFYQSNITTFQELEKYDILVPLKDRFFPYFITYDFEAILQKLPVTSTNKLLWEERHTPVSVGVGSNVPGFEKGVCFVDFDLDNLLSQMLKDMENISQKVRGIQQQRYLWVFDKLETLLNRFKDEEIHTAKVTDKVFTSLANQFANSVTEVDEFEPPCKKFKKRIGMVNSFDRMIKHLEETGTLKAEFYNFTSDESDGDSENDDELVNDEHCLGQSCKKSLDTRAKFRKTMFKKITALKQRFEHYCSCTPVLGFNSSKYDLNLKKKEG